MRPKNQVANCAEKGNDSELQNDLGSFPRYISLKEKVLLVTGGSRGLGLVLAREFAKRGAKVAICARNHEQLERVRKEFAHRRQPLFAMVCDVGIGAEVGQLAQAVYEQFGQNRCSC